jgi:cysteine desulfurase family protein
MDNSATSYPKPPSVIEAVKNAVDSISSNPGRSSHKGAIKSAMMLYEARETVADFINTKPENVVFTYNATSALNFAILGGIKSGYRVATTVFEHNSVLRPLYRLEREKGVKIDFLKVSTEDINVLCVDLVNRIDNGEKPDAVIMTHTSNVIGARMPIRQVGKICHDNGILFIVDASQGLGTSRLDMDKDGIDVLCASGHKGLFGIMGSGFMAISKGCKHTLEPVMSGGAGILSYEKFMPKALPERFEAGTLGLLGIESIRAGIEYINRVGSETLAEQSHKRRVRLSEGLSCIPKVKLYAPEADSISIVLFNIESLSADRVALMLDDEDIACRSGFHCSPLAHDFLNSGGAVRLSVSAFNTDSECDKVLTVIEDISKGLL